ncbi:UNVERIFIED_ORG: DNA-binding transcriptional LysR family regulator [Rhizobium sp. SORGH_AS260]|uniref:LysR family transcriptional regulator n=1 Tax=Agrobacterium sp. SORGH_AS_0440 TaxID=3041757 RepID=UPI0027882403|nr:LysR family transcriptional regulator [Agrobacterium sp. SORGH_AS_0440]MDP9734845.1 DNA-binding transcriptional LysR family regulator [Rhizobium sp. SORGH_AS_0285]MDP9757064.1 DNA-binding transcriptional LysR family regulator [Rhizobium sp. SORGH_AS_0260]MDR6084198.1 DNA-binding transcriptional LysR family regulator [Agrobacterium sp. SORGH_AS_0440]
MKATSPLGKEALKHFIDAQIGSKAPLKKNTYSQEVKMARRFDHLGDVEAFVTVAEKGSMTEGAVVLSTTPSVLSRAITRLESRLGAQLMRRTTRRLSLTDEGRAYLEQARAAFSMIDDAERGLQGRTGAALRGHIRLSVPTTYGHYRLPAMLDRFMQSYPKVQIELSITNRNVDLVAEGYDLAIRLGPLPDSGMAARKLEDAPLRLVASPRYLERAGVPLQLEDLAKHRCLPFIMPSTGRCAPWLFRVDGRDLDWTPASQVQVFDDVLGVVSLAESGLGICQSYDFIVQDRIEQGRLVEVLQHARGRSRPFSLVFAPHRRLSTATRTLIDFLARNG